MRHGRTLAPTYTGQLAQPSSQHQVTSHQCGDPERRHQAYLLCKATHTYTPSYTPTQDSAPLHTYLHTPVHPTQPANSYTHSRTLSCTACTTNYTCITPVNKHTYKCLHILYTYIWHRQVHSQTYLHTHAHPHLHMHLTPALQELEELRLSYHLP
jgi:hypothetical protein